MAQVIRDVTIETKCEDAIGIKIRILPRRFSNDIPNLKDALHVYRKSDFILPIETLGEIGIEFLSKAIALSDSKESEILTEKILDIFKQKKKAE